MSTPTAREVLLRRICWAGVEPEHADDLADHLLTLDPSREEWPIDIVRSIAEHNGAAAEIRPWHEYGDLDPRFAFKLADMWDTTRRLHMECRALGIDR